MKLFNKKLLSIEVASRHIRAALLEKNGNLYKILDLLQMDRPDPEDDLPSIDAIKTLASRLKYDFGPVVFVTPLARAVEIPMDRGKISGMKHYQIMEAAKWEVEPFTGITGANALVGVEKVEQPSFNPGMVIEFEDDEDTFLVNVSVIEKNVYRAVRERFKEAGLSLKRIYAPDVCFYMPLFMQESKIPRAILEIGTDYSNFAILKGNRPSLINTLTISTESIEAHLSGENPSEELEEVLKHTAKQVPEPEPLVISGQGAENNKIVNYISSFCANGAKPIIIVKTSGVKSSGDEGSNAVYATVAGAGIRELKSAKKRLAGINDTEPLVPRLKKSAYIMPLAATIFLFIILFSHFQYMKFSEKSMKTKIKTITAELKRRNARILKYDTAVKKVEDIKKKIEHAKKKIVFVKKNADEDIRYVINLFFGTSGSVPESVVLKTLAQNNLYEYRLSGISLDLSSIGNFATKIQEKEWCKSVIIESVKKEDPVNLKFKFLIKSRITIR